MPIVIKATGPKWDVSQPIKGEFVKEYDPEAHNGRGEASFTTKLDEALKFGSIEEAASFIEQVPDSRPTHADGRPNKPIRSFHLDLLQEEDL